MMDSHSAICECLRAKRLHYSTFFGITFYPDYSLLKWPPSLWWRHPETAPPCAPPCTTPSSRRLRLMLLNLRFYLRAQRTKQRNGSKRHGMKNMSRQKRLVTSMPRLASWLLPARYNPVPQVTNAMTPSTSTQRLSRQVLEYCHILVRCRQLTRAHCTRMSGPFRSGSI